MRLLTSAGAGRLAFSAAAAALAIIVGAGPAAAAATWTVTPGGRFTGMAGRTTLQDTTTGNSLICTRSSVGGTFKTGRGLVGAGIGSIGSGTITGCSSTLPIFVTLRGLPWHINVTSYASGVVHGTISHIQITVALAGCSFMIDGSAAGASDGAARFAYSDSTHKLTVLPTRGNLHIYMVSGCAGLVHNGDGASYTASYTISPGQTITSP